MFDFFDMMYDREDRKLANTEVDGGVVDTCRVTDSSKPFETGIAHPSYNEGKWVIVELYDSKEDALSGHEKWIEKIKMKPDFLEDINECEFGDFAEAVCPGSTRMKFPRKQE